MEQGNPRTSRLSPLSPRCSRFHFEVGDVKAKESLCVITDVHKDRQANESGVLKAMSVCTAASITPTLYTAVHALNHTSTTYKLKLCTIQSVTVCRRDNGQRLLSYIAHPILCKPFRLLRFATNQYNAQQVRIQIFFFIHCYARTIKAFNLNNTSDLLMQLCKRL